MKANYDRYFRAADGYTISMNEYETHCNNHAMINGGSGAGKTTSVVIPALHDSGQSEFIVDPKGRLYELCAPYLRAKGYDIHLIDFTDPLKSEGYNPLEYITSTQDINKISSIITYFDKEDHPQDQYWNQNELILSNALIGYLYESHELSVDLASVLRLNTEGERRGDSDEDKDSLLSLRFEELKKRNPKSWACEKFEQVNVAPRRTFDCIRTTLSGKLSQLDTPELRDMMIRGGFSFVDAAKKKTAVFVTVSDTDRSMDMFANIFFSQAMNELCEFADKECGGRLPVPVRFILDDFATNCVIADFPKMISSVRSRGISVMLLIQAESQLTNTYGKDGSTIISNCDTYVYLGSNDISTAQAISLRCDRELSEVLYMPRKTCWVFRAGEKPVYAKIIDPKPIIEEMKKYHNDKGKELAS